MSESVIVENTLHDDLGDEYADLTSHDAFVRAVPHAAFARLRREDPVAWIDEADGAGFWAVTRYDDIVEVSREWRTFTVTRGIRLEEMDDEEMFHRRTMMEHDPPEHARLRRLVQKGFTPRVVATYEDAFRLLAGEVLDRALSLGDFDFVAEIAQELPIRLMSRLLGVPESDADLLVEWGDRMIANTDPDFADFVVDRDDTEEYRLLPFRSPAALEVFRYAEEAAMERRANPTDDVISGMLQTADGAEPLTDLEFKNFFALLIVAGNETTRHTISHGLRFLVGHPDQLARLEADPAGLSASATEEILRAASVTMHFRRTATTDTELNGTHIRQGDKVVMWYPSGNYDDSAFDRPFTFQMTREPNDHLARGVTCVWERGWPVSRSGWCWRNCWQGCRRSRSPVPPAACAPTSSTGSSRCR
jgi:cytochrome P450